MNPALPNLCILYFETYKFRYSAYEKKKILKKYMKGRAG